MIALLPTPGSPTRSGWCLWRRSRICSSLRTSTSRPMTGSNSPRRARSTRSVVNAPAVHARRRSRVARHAAQRPHVRPERSGPEPELLEHRRGRPAELLGERVQQVLDLHRPCARFLLRAREEREHRARQVREPRPGLPEPPEGRLGLARHVGRRGSGPADHLGHPGVAIERAREEVNRLHLSMLALVGERLRPGHERLRVGRVAIEVYRLFSGHGRRRRVARARPGSSIRRTPCAAAASNG